MRQSYRSRAIVGATVGVAAAIGLLAGGGDALAAGKKKAKKGKAAVVRSLQTPLGLQGVRGAGNAVGLPFSLIDKSRRATDVDVEYGYDRNGDGEIADGTDPSKPSEYERATEDRRDPRNTRKNKKPNLFTTAGDIGASHQFVWNSAADVGSDNLPTTQYQYTPEGRPVPDPNNPGSFLFADTQPGVKLRARAHSRTGAVGEWVYTDAFALNNNTPPSMTIDSVIPNTTSTPTASDEAIEIRWTAFDNDSEDLNGNGVLDVLDLEDANGNSQLDAEFVAVAFDYWRIPDGVDPTTFTDDQLDALVWLPCSRADGVGEPSDGVPSAPEGVGVQHTFAWDSVRDVGTVHARFILRATPFDAKQERGPTVYFTQGFLLDNWKVFNTPGAAANLPAGRAGAAVVNLTPGLQRSDPAYEPPLQSFLVTGGSTTADGPGTDYLAVEIVNTESAETSTASAARFASLGTSRSYHSATVLDDGRVLLAGGLDASGLPLSSTEIYDPLTHTITNGPDLLVARAKHAAVKLASGDVAFFGGLGSGGQALASAEIFHFTPVGQAPGVNSALPNLAVAQVSPHAALLPDQRVLVAGGVTAAGAAVTTAQLLAPLNDDDPSDPTTKNPRFDSAGSMRAARAFCSATPLLDGNVLFAGGSGLSSMEVFNWQTGVFEDVNGTMPDGARAQHVATLLGDGSVLLAGGITSVGTGSLVSSADVFRLGARNGATGTWDGTFLPVNGDMRFPRRLASSCVVNNGRVFIVGGLNATGGALAELETFTPENGRNLRPAARTFLESPAQSWAFGAPVVYRVTDPEQDPVRVIVQWSDNGGVTWHAAAPQATTIGGDVADTPAGLTTGAVDIESLRIDPRTFPISDHKYIWGMSNDIPRPAVGQSTGPYIFRTTPFGAVQGAAAQSGPVTVTYNTKVIPTILPLEDADGTVNPQQGGDISIVVHLRDIDGAGVGARPGDAAYAEFEYAIDTNNDGIINQGTEFWVQMSQSGAGVDPSKRGANGANRINGLTTWSESYLDSGPAFGERDPANGWAVFHWDSVFDLGAPIGSFGNVWVRVTPYDNLAANPADQGFQAILRNEPGQPETIRIIRHPDALYLDRMVPKAGNPNNVSVNEPIEFHFNGLVDPTTVTTTAIQVTRNGNRVEGVFTTQNDVPNNTSVVTFYPQVQSTVNGTAVYSAAGNPTIFFPLTDYSITIPGYAKGTDPRAGVTLRPQNAGFPTVIETYLLALNTPSNLAIRTGSGTFADGAGAALTVQSPNAGQTLLQSQGFSLTVSNAVNVNTAISPNLTVTIDNSASTSTGKASSSVVPGTWSVTNFLNVDGTRSSQLVFTPLAPMPSQRVVRIASNSGLKTAGGLAVSSIATNYNVTNWGSHATSFTETFTNTTYEDATVAARARWGDDACNTGVLTGLQDSATPPQGGIAYTVASGQTEDITATTSDFASVTVPKGSTLRIRATAPATIRATGDITIHGTVDFRGEDGWTGHYGNTSSSVYFLYAVQNNVGTRLGGTGYNGGGDGGSSAANSSTVRVSGGNGGGTGGGQGGPVGTGGSSSGYYYGATGGAGGGNGQPGQTTTRGSNYWNTSTISPPATGGPAVGDRMFTNGPSQAGGGGGGGSNRYSSRWYHNGGGGGAGGGTVTFLCDGTFNLSPTGLLDGRGGAGGSSAHLAGSGGGGAGGSCMIKAGVQALLDGIIDLRGGKSGPAAFAAWNDYYAYYNAWSLGTIRTGGDGGGGRLVVMAPNFLNYDEVRVFGQMTVQQVTSLPTSTQTATSPDSRFASGGSINFGTTGEVRYTSLTVPAGKVVDLTGSKALRIFVTGAVQIDGTIRLNGQVPPFSYTNPEFDGGSGTPPTNYTGGSGRQGGGAGGAGHTIGGTASSTNGYKRRGQDGNGPAPGKNLAVSNMGYTWSTYYVLYSGDSGGGGGANATDGDHGWSPYALSSRYNYVGAATDTTGNGLSPATVETNSGAGGKRIDASSVSIANLDNGVGSGGAGGNLGGYSYTYYSWNYFGLTGGGGGGAGALGIVGSGTVTVNGTIEAKGGNGNPGGASAEAVYIWNWTNSTYALSSYTHSAGGGGSGGTVFIVGDTVNIGRVTTGEGSTANGARFDMTGGIGGGWRQNYGANYDQWQAYNALGYNGGDGGFGRLIVNYKTSLNGGRTLFNRWGMEQTVYPDITKRWTSLAGTAYAACRGKPGGNDFSSTWYDLGSIAPVVNSVSAGTQSNVVLTLQAEGAQSQPHANAPNAANTSGLKNSGAAMLDGWRYLRFAGRISRPNTNPTTPAPVVDNVQVTHTTDGP